MFSDFDDRTAADMEVALHRACSQLTADMAENHEVRTAIARAILACATGSKPKLVELTAVARRVAMKFAAQNPPTSIAS